MKLGRRSYLSRLDVTWGRMRGGLLQAGPGSRRWAADGGGEEHRRGSRRARRRMMTGVDMLGKAKEGLMGRD